MKGLNKRKRKFTRNLKGPSSKNPDQKNTNFEYAAFRQNNAMQASENAQQVRAAIAPAKAPMQGVLYLKSRGTGLP
jgi:hypothetical protein